MWRCRATRTGGTRRRRAACSRANGMDCGWGAPWCRIPASQWQPDGPAALSAAVEAGSFAWSDAAWQGRPWHETVLYELHVGTFTAAGTFEAAIEHLPHLGAAGRDDDRADAGGRIRGRAGVGIRRGAAVRAVSPLRHPGRAEAVRRCEPRVGPLGGARRGVQPFRAVGELPAGLRAGVLHRGARDPVGRGDRLPAARRCGRSSSRMRCIGSGSSISMGCGWMRCRRCSTTVPRTSWTRSPSGHAALGGPAGAFDARERQQRGAVVAPRWILRRPVERRFPSCDAGADRRAGGRLLSRLRAAAAGAVGPGVGRGVLVSGPATNRCIGPG